jgi:F-type H+-transporting ATPase subunit gamma
MSLKVIKNKIRSISKTKQVTKAMESVAAVKMRKSQKSAFDTRPYAFHAFGILKRISRSYEGGHHPLMESRKINKVCLLVITSDRGLAGNLNNALLKKVTSEMKDKNLTKENTGFICIGRKGYEYFSKKGFFVEKYYKELGDMVSVDMLKEVSELLIKLYEDEKYDSFITFYTNFISTTDQKPVIRTMLPITYSEVRKIVKYTLPKKGKYSEFRRAIDIDKEAPYEFIFEPDAGEVLKELLPFLLNVQVYYSFLEAKASEHSARMVAMKNASDKAEEMSIDLKRKFNKERQAVITREISEITGGIEAMST